MMDKSEEYWRGYFSGANADIFAIIESAVMVAALDNPKELKLRRDRISELLFTCDRNGETTILELEEDKFKSSDDTCLSYEEAQFLIHHIEGDSHLVKEVFRIKEILDNHQQESDVTLFDSLQRLQVMDLSVELLKETEIGKSVNGLKKHGSKQIRNLAQTLKEGWIASLDSWVVATTAIAENALSETMKTSTIEFDEGLPCPPLDEGALFSHSLDLFDFFDDMDDDFNPRNHEDANNNPGSGRKPPLKDGSVPKQKQQLPNDLFSPLKNKLQHTMKEETVMKKKAVVLNPHKPSREVTGSTRPEKTRAEQKLNNKLESQLKKDEMAVQKKPLAPHDYVSRRHREQPSANGTIRKPMPPQQEKVGSSDEEALLQVKIAASKRKLQERYQEAEDAKKQRTIQVVELRDIPKPGRNRLMKTGHYNHNRHWANKRQ